MGKGDSRGAVFSLALLRHSECNHWSADANFRVASMFEKFESKGFIITFSLTVRGYLAKSTAVGFVIVKKR